MNDWWEWVDKRANSFIALKIAAIKNKILTSPHGKNYGKCSELTRHEVDFILKEWQNAASLFRNGDSKLLKTSLTKIFFQQNLNDLKNN